MFTAAGQAARREDSAATGTLLQAMSDGKVQLARFILAARGESIVNTRAGGAGGAAGRTVLMCAALLPRPADRTLFLRLALAKGADVNLRDEGGRTALSLASERGYLDVVKLLLRHGADPGISDEQGRTALAYGVREGHKAVVRFLLKESEGPEQTGRLCQDHTGGSGGVPRDPREDHSRGKRGEGRLRPQRPEECAGPPELIHEEQEGRSGHGGPQDSQQAQREGSGPPGGWRRLLRREGAGTLAELIIRNPYTREEEREGGACPAVRGPQQDDESSPPGWSAHRHFPLPPLASPVIRNPVFATATPGRRREARTWPGPSLDRPSQKVQSQQSPAEPPRPSFLPSWLTRVHSQPPPSDPAGRPPHGSFPKPPSGWRRWTVTRSTTSCGGPTQDEEQPSRTLSSLRDQPETPGLYLNPAADCGHSEPPRPLQRSPPQDPELPSSTSADPSASPGRESTSPSETPDTVLRNKWFQERGSVCDLTERQGCLEVGGVQSSAQASHMKRQGGGVSGSPRPLGVRRRHPSPEARGPIGRQTHGHQEAEVISLRHSQPKA
nr:PREDICTED: ankyrin repeat domain-containing protein 34A-like [Lepisosteus oculatus]XP_015196275.1 PREDICTED: ankyrin repeat domain-containing protein 34A-like [Lepisosteus oculatus]XP_015196276.1 PREDICTED: ankyrin repeat domain-containing protein 34A-like [Lepisosteus oculatus]